jgi:carbamoylphosphate synthase large subunit
MKNILVTAAGGGAGINALKLLSKYNNLSLYATDIDKLASGQVFAKEFKTMSPFLLQKEYKKELRNLVEEWKINYIIPTLQEELEDIEDIVSDMKVKLLLSSKETIKICCNKREFYLWIQKHFPEFLINWTTLDNLEALGNFKDSDTIFVKPTKGRGSSNCYLLDNKTIKTFINNAKNLKEWVAMEYMPGSEWTVDCYIKKDGEIAFTVPRKRLRILDGVSLKGTTINNKKIIENTKKIINKLNFKGPICVQWIEDVDGTPKIMEINPRFSGGGLITVAAGADAMECFYKEIYNIPFKKVAWKEITALGYLDYRILK